MSAAVASNRLADLEHHLGVRLFNRSTRSVKPTEHGIALHEGAKRVLATVEDMESDVAKLSGAPRGTIFVGAQFNVGRHLLPPLIAAFHEQYPDVRVRLRLSDRKMHIVEEGLDMAFVVDKLFDSGLRMRAIAECRRGLFAAPALIERYGMPDSISNVIDKAIPCLQLRFPGAHEFRWNLKVGDQVKAFQVSGPFESDDGAVLTQWAIAGHGIVNKPVFEVAEHIASGTLVEVARQTPPEAVRMALLLPDRRLQDTKTKVFADYMTTACRRILEAMPDAQLPR